MKANNKIRSISLLLIIILLATENLFGFLVKNILLAYIPFELSQSLLKTESKRLQYFLFFLWFIFYPNTFYMLTDFTHLIAIGTDLSTPYQYYHYALLLISVIFGMFLGIYSLMNVRKWYGQSTFDRLFYLILSLISSIAIYIGRFLRLHTHDLLIQPFEVALTVLQSINKDMLIFVLIFTAVQCFIIELFHILKEKNRN